MYRILWEYNVPEEARERFERVYGAEGEWAQLFRGEQGFLGTTLLRDPDRPGRYLTIDRWESRDAYDRFRSRRVAEYSAIDRRCEDLNSGETHLGSLEIVAEVPST